MFVCETCLAKNYENHPSISQSYGRCEDCGVSAGCSDIPSKYLRSKGRVMTVVTHYDRLDQLIRAIHANKDVHLLRFWESTEHIGVINHLNQAYAITRHFVDNHETEALLRRAIDQTPSNERSKPPSALDKMDKLLGDD